MEGMSDKVKAQNSRFQRSGSSVTLFCTTDARINEIESKVVAVKIMHKIVNTAITTVLSGSCSRMAKMALVEPCWLRMATHI
ncbi:hypothetical protein JS85_25840 [Vibrio vulnificus]|nr:hypothetical protein JS85_25840 [Vibrio vulnificus]